MEAVSEQELNLSTKLNALLGDLGAEMALLPTERTIERWTTSDALRSVCRCKDALIDALHCAVRLSQLGKLDEISQQWIAEVLKRTEEVQSRLDYVEGDLIRECPRSLW